MKEALEAVARRPVSRETVEQVQRYIILLREEAERQNLIARSTLQDVWQRHILDSAQLAQFEPEPGCSWVDIGSGAGLPGIIIALLVEGPVTLVEPRRLRAEFLERAATELGLAPRVSVELSKAERISGAFDVITGRAVASLGQFLDLSHHLSTEKSIWVLPKGKGAQSELAEARRNWHCTVRAVSSSTDPDSQILVLKGVGAKSQ